MERARRKLIAAAAAAAAAAPAPVASTAAPNSNAAASDGTPRYAGEILSGDLDVLLPSDAFFATRYVSASRHVLRVWADHRAYVAAGDAGAPPSGAPLAALPLASSIVLMGGGVVDAINAPRSSPPTPYVLRLLPVSSSDAPAAPLVTLASHTWAGMQAWHTTLAKVTQQPASAPAAAPPVTAPAAAPDATARPPQAVPPPPAAAPSLAPAARRGISRGAGIALLNEADVIAALGVHHGDAGKKQSSVAALEFSLPEEAQDSREGHSVDSAAPSPALVSAAPPEKVGFARRVDSAMVIGRVSDTDSGVGLKTPHAAAYPSSAAAVRFADAPLPSPPSRAVPVTLSVALRGVPAPPPPRRVAHSKPVPERTMAPTEASRARMAAVESERLARLRAEEDAAAEEARARARARNASRSRAQSAAPASVPISASSAPAAAAAAGAPVAGGAVAAPGAGAGHGHVITGMRDFVASTAAAPRPYVPDRMNDFHRSLGVRAPSSSRRAFEYPQGHYERVGWASRALGRRGDADASVLAASEAFEAAAAAGVLPAGGSARVTGSGAPATAGITAAAAPALPSPIKAGAAGLGGAAALDSSTMSRFSLMSRGAPAVSLAPARSSSAGAPVERGRSRVAFRPAGSLADTGSGLARGVAAAAPPREDTRFRALSPGIKRSVMWGGQAWPAAEAAAMTSLLFGGGDSSLFGAAAPAPVAARLPPVAAAGSNGVAGMLLDHIADIESRLAAVEAENSTLKGAGGGGAGPRAAAAPSYEARASGPSYVVEQILTSPSDVTASLSSCVVAARAITRGLGGGASGGVPTLHHAPHMQQGPFPTLSRAPSTATPASDVTDRAHLAAMVDAARRVRGALSGTATPADMSFVAANESAQPPAAAGDASLVAARPPAAAAAAASAGARASSESTHTALTLSAVLVGDGGDPESPLGTFSNDQDVTALTVPSDGAAFGALSSLSLSAARSESHTKLFFDAVHAAPSSRLSAATLDALSRSASGGVVVSAASAETALAACVGGGDASLLLRLLMAAVSKGAATVQAVAVAAAPADPAQATLLDALLPAARRAAARSPRFVGGNEASAPAAPALEGAVSVRITAAAEAQRLATLLGGKLHESARAASAAAPPRGATALVVLIEAPAARTFLVLASFDAFAAPGEGGILRAAVVAASRLGRALPAALSPLERLVACHGGSTVSVAVVHDWGSDRVRKTT